MFAGDYYLGAVMQAYLPSFSPTFTLSRQMLVFRRTIHNQNKLSPKVAPLAVRYRTPFLSRGAFYKPDNTAKMFMTENGLKEKFVSRLSQPALPSDNYMCLANLC